MKTFIKNTLKNTITSSYDITPDIYTTYYIKPDYTINNKDNISIINAFSYAYKPLIKRLGVGLKTTKVQFTKQLYFTIILKKNDAKFYISIPEDYSQLIRGKMSTTWSKAELRECEVPKIVNKNSVGGELIQRDYNFKSIQCSTGDLYPLTNMLGIVNGLSDKEEVRITLVVEPYGKHNWLEKQKTQIADFKNGKTKDVEKSRNEKLFDSGMKVAEEVLDLGIEITEFVFDSVFSIFDSPTKEEKQNDIKVTINDKRDENKISDLSDFTRYKLNSEVFTGRIIITSTGGTIERNKLNLISVANSYIDLEGDNALSLKQLNNKATLEVIDSINRKLVKVGKQNIFSDKEISKFIQLPQKDLQNRFNLERIDTREVDVPEPLQNGKVRIGIAEKVGKEIVATFNDNYNVVPRTTVVVGPQGAGKTTLLKRLGLDNYKAGYSNFVLDYVEDCETARALIQGIPRKDLVVYDVGKKGARLSLAFNEISKHITDEMDVWDRIRYANLLADQLELVLNTIKTDSTSELTSPMMRYLHSASMITFIKPRATINDVFKVIKNYKYREEMVKYAKHSRCFRLDDEIFTDLEEIDKKDKGKVVGTRTDLTIGIENRISMLLKNPDIKDMLNEDINLDDDFTEYIAAGKTIVVMIPQNRFPNEMIRDTLAVYYFSRLWLACQLRKNNKEARLCNVIIDEVGQVEILSKFIGQYCTEFRRHRLGLTLAMHHLQQMKGLLKQLTSSGASYLLLAGIEKKNVEALKEEILPFTIEDVMNLKTHTSLNAVNYGNQYARFVTRQPIK